MTSCSARRNDQYEKISLWDFLQADKLGERHQRHLVGSQRVLLAMDIKRSDARTQGNILTRIFMDQMSSGGKTDRLLNGPTSERWFYPWLRQLEKLGVSFRFGSALRRFDVGERGINAAYVASGAREEERIDADYYVSSLPIDALVNVFDRSPHLEAFDLAEARASNRADDAPLSDIRFMSSNPDFQAWMSGIQFYLSEDASFLPGHIQFVDSEWALSMVSQAQFWGGDFQHRYGGGQVRGLLSVEYATSSGKVT
jgi:uncharacterized protein with NAD-binding domain and iron-sulfur cluster